ncbi:DUF3180 domain-containing protein [Spongisporangium articulatum]|uniref:DUF3180 domain-containing protein n=1 Tax=Spongisporangium articulatum TaxID=3362603 RepID=A0ABW8APQ5_9ACTN
MKAARPLLSLLIGLVSLAVSWVFLDMWTKGGGSRPPLSWASPVAVLAIAVAVVAAGLPVRRWVHDGRGAVDPLVAARTAVLAKAAAYGGALLVGWFAGQGLVLLPDLVGERQRDLLIAGLTTLAALLLVVAGYVVQHWCRVPPDDRDEDPTGDEG